MRCFVQVVAGAATANLICTCVRYVMGFAHSMLSWFICTVSAGPATATLTIGV
jgi:hypothetical protein